MIIRSDYYLHTAYILEKMDDEVTTARKNNSRNITTETYALNEQF